MTIASAGPKKFNTAGPCDPARHYLLPPLERLPEVRSLVSDGSYFVIHAARQSGKTTFLRAVTDEINAEGKFHALYCSLESLQGVEDDEKAMPRAVDLTPTPPANRLNQRRWRGQLTGLKVSRGS